MRLDAVNLASNAAIVPSWRTGLRWIESREKGCFAGGCLRAALVISALATAAYAQQPAANDPGNASTTTSAPATNSTDIGSQDPATPASSSSAQSSAAPMQGQQTKRILGVIPNFRAVSVDTDLPPQSPKEKFVGFAQDSFDYSSFIWIGALAGVSLVDNSIPQFGQGAAGYGRYYWRAFIDQTNENLWVAFLLPVAFRQDPRYYTLGRETANGYNGPFKRTGYAVSRLFITRTDSGGTAFNTSEVGGSGAAAALSNLYYPASQRTWTKTYQRWILNVGLDGMTNVFREFWPDINHAIFHGK